MEAEHPEIILIATRSQIAYLDTFADQAGTIVMDEEIQDSLDIDKQLEQIYQAVTTGLEKKFSTRKIEYWQSHQPVKIETYNQRLFHFLKSNLFDTEDQIKLPNPGLVLKLLWRITKARKLTIADYYKARATKTLKSPVTTLSPTLISKLTTALLLVKHLTPLRFDCYTVSYSISCYLSDLGIRHKLHLGINPSPLIMHAWISVDDIPLFDLPSTSQEFYTAIEVKV